MIEGIYIPSSNLGSKELIIKARTKRKDQLFSVLITAALLAGASQSCLPQAWVIIQRTETGMRCSVETFRCQHLQEWRRRHWEMQKTRPFTVHPCLSGQVSVVKWGALENKEDKGGRGVEREREKWEQSRLSHGRHFVNDLNPNFSWLSKAVCLAPSSGG